MAPHILPNVSEQKRVLRRFALEQRDRLGGSDGHSLAAVIAAYLGGALPAVIAGYWPIGSEIDVRPALLALAARGARLCLPQTTEPGKPLTFHDWTPGIALLPGRFGTSHPQTPAVRPDLLLVPLLAYDRSCHRLGYGGGYYDRTLASLPHVTAIGCAHAFQEVDRVPTGLHDRRLNAIATERGVITI